MSEPHNEECNCCGWAFAQGGDHHPVKRWNEDGHVSVCTPCYGSQGCYDGEVKSNPSLHDLIQQISHVANYQVAELVRRWRPMRTAPAGVTAEYLCQDGAIDFRRDGDRCQSYKAWRPAHPEWQEAGQ